MELRLKTPSKYLFSSFETLHWYAAAGLIDELKSKPVSLVSLDDTTSYRDHSVGNE